MRHLKTNITLKEIEQAFIDSEEKFTITAINFKFVNDCHYNDFELSIEFMGEESEYGLFQENYPVAEYAINIDTLLINGSSSIQKKQLLSIFDSALMDLIIKDKVKIIWNGDDEESCRSIDVTTPGDETLPAMIM